ncbi:hypothetical protein KOR34_37370 [Posidoniimonas corsicana]|uniref:Helix-turn-helix domain protein n=1 Tax=Posidoniimonas corsicana TaxID=1938618 RepID=A0A5C5V6L4_9BACT|nr:hypothetical protein [Posidoniimonas corsicana]TWT33901.1 hypothetical protein KOR34_37370 [Posidoniimonas corsicana]
MDFLTTKQVAELLGVEPWRVRRLYETAALPEPGRFGGKRALPRSAVADVAIALRRRGWLPAVSPASTLQEAGRDG